MADITTFQGPHRFLSNFFAEPFSVPLPMCGEPVIVPTAEHAYQALKTHNPEEVTRILAARTPGAARRAGQRAEIREDWEVVKIGIMDHVLKHKFIRGSALAEQLTATGDARLVEGNNWGDTFWGVSRGEGENWLGKLLTLRRSQLGGHP